MQVKMIERPDGFPDLPSMEDLINSACHRLESHEGYDIEYIDISTDFTKVMIAYK